MRPPEAKFDELLLAQGRSPALDVQLSKGDRRRRYYIRLGASASEWYCAVWFDDLQHRGVRVLGVVEAQRCLTQFRREIAELRTDG